MNSRFHIDTSNPMPIYAQLERAIQFAIATGTLRIGEQLPTVRQLAVELSINANTVAKVYAELERTGIVETRRGVGTFVREQPTQATRNGSSERALRSIADCFMADAASLGLSPGEVLAYLTNWYVTK